MGLLRVGDEPIPGYKLISKLGQGGFGTVWKAEGPGGIECALKFLSLGDRQGLKEFQSVRLLKKVRHPNLIPMAAFWLRDGNGNVLGSQDNQQGSSEFQNKNCDLVIHLALGDKSLVDRLVECRGELSKEAIGGLPTEELLRYMTQAASAIDYLNQPIHAVVGSDKAALRHGDIKPGNILIAGNGIWVCDFGLSGILGGTDIRTSIGKPMYTPAYAAPEILRFKGPSTTSDQYSLAVTFVELRSGRLPYEATARQAVEALIVLGDVYLDFLPASEQKVLRRALSLDPAERFRTCSELIDELRKAISEQSGRIGRPPNAAELFFAGSTVVPGFKLKQCLGRGGYGEVWKAAGAGRDAALKIVQNLSDRKGRQEWRALEAIKEELDHPHLMGLQGFWLLDAWGHVFDEEDRERQGGSLPAYLVIHTELAAKNLRDRLKECQEHGHRGIPVSELLEYMEQAARALDYLNQEKHAFGEKEGVIIHRDIKPENILLTKRSHVKIADFGLAKMMEGAFDAISRNSEGSTLIYGAPELHKNKLSRWTDQYSLAVTYFHLRMGRLPMDMSLSPLELNIRSGLGQLELDDLPDAERAVIARATSFAPENRYPTCREMVADLFRAVGATPPSSPSVIVDERRSDPLQQAPPSSPVSLPTSDSGHVPPPMQPPLLTSDFDRKPMSEFLPSSGTVATAPPQERPAKPHVDPGIIETDNPVFAHDIRETPKPPSDPSVTSVYMDRGPSSGDLLIPEPPLRTVPKQEPPRVTPVPPVSRPKSDPMPQRFLDDDDSDSKPVEKKKPSWHDIKEQTVKPASKHDAEPEDDWRRPRQKKPPVAGIVGGIAALAIIVGVVMWLIRDGDGVKNVSQAPVWIARLETLVKIEKPSSGEQAEANELIAKLRGENHQDAVAWQKSVDRWRLDIGTRRLESLVAAPWTSQSGQEAEQILKNLKNELAAPVYSKWESDLKRWATPIRSPKDLAHSTIQGFIEADDLKVTKKQLADAVGALEAFRKTAATPDDQQWVTECSTSISQKKKKAAEAKLKAAIDEIPAPPLTDKPKANEIQSRLTEIQNDWLVDAKSNKDLTSLQALMEAWTTDQVALTRAALQSGTQSLLPQLIWQFLRLTKPGERDSVLSELWKKRTALPANGRDFLVAYRDQVRKDIYKQLAAATVDESQLRSKCLEAKEVDPNDPLIMLVDAELSVDKLSAETRAGILDLRTSQDRGLNQDYLRYIHALVKHSSHEETDAAEIVQALYSDQGEVDPLLRVAARSKRAATVLMSAVNSLQRTNRHPLGLPFDADVIGKVKGFVDAAFRIDPENRQACIAAAVFFAFGPAPNPARSAAAARQLLKSWPDEQAAGHYSNHLKLVRADVLAASSESDNQVAAVRQYLDSLKQLRRLESRMRDKESMSLVASVFQRAIKLGEQASTSGDAKVKECLADLYGLRGGWVFERWQTWGHAADSEGYAAANNDFKAAINISENPNKANYRLWKVVTDLKLKQLTAPQAVKEVEEICKEAPNVARPRGWLAVHKLDSAIVLLSADRQKANLAFGESLADFEAAISYCRSPDDDQVKAGYLHNAVGICRHLAVEGINSKANLAKAGEYIKQAAELAIYDDALSWSSQGKLWEDLALLTGNGTHYPQAIAAFDRAVEHEPKSKYFVDRGRITMRGVAFGSLKWSALNRARDDLNRALADKNSTPLTTAEGYFFLSLIDLMEHKLAQSTANYTKAISQLPNDAAAQKLAYLSLRGRSLCLEKEWLTERKQLVPPELGAEISKIAEELTKSLPHEAVWLRGVVLSMNRNASPMAEADLYLTALPRFPQEIGGLEQKNVGSTSYPGLLPLLAWLRLYMRVTDVETKNPLPLAKIGEIADVLVKAGEVMASQDIGLRALTLATAGRLHIFAAYKQGNTAVTERQSRERGIELLRDATKLVSKSFPTSWSWRFDLGREVIRSLSDPELNSVERQKRAKESQEVLNDALQEAPEDSRRKIEDELKKIG